MAAVLVEDVWLGMHFDDNLTLLHHDGTWIIVAKVFYLRPSKDWLSKWAATRSGTQ